jgi:hypothetical protein
VYSTSGGVIHQTVIPADPLAFFERTADEVYVLGNSAGQGHLMIYDNTTNGFWEPISLPAGTITCATTIDANTILIGISDGNIYRFTYMPVGILTWATGVSPTILRYDDVNAEVYSAEGTNVKVYSYNPFVLQHTIPIPYAVSDLELWYNK